MFGLYLCAIIMLSSPAADGTLVIVFEEIKALSLPCVSSMSIKRDQEHRTSNIA